MRLRTSCFSLLLAVCSTASSQDHPAAFAAFEVASVKVSPPIDRTKPPTFGCKGGPGTTDPGLYVCRYSTLQTLVIEAFDLASYQFPFVPSGDHTTYDIEAKVPAGATREQFRAMLQNLLAERLKLSYHFENKAAQVYELTVAKNGPRLHPSPTDSSEKPKPAASAARDEYGFRNVSADFQGQMIDRNRDVARWVARSVTTAQMAKMLAARLQGAVTDRTSLEGKYDFTLYFSATSAGSGVGPSPAGAGKKVGEEAAEGVNLPTVFAVMQDKLGLTLQKKQGSFDLFVVDHVEKAPLEN